MKIIIDENGNIYISERLKNGYMFNWKYNQTFTKSEAIANFKKEKKNLEIYLGIYQQ